MCASTRFGLACGERLIHLECPLDLVARQVDRGRRSMRGAACRVRSSVPPRRPARVLRGSGARSPALRLPRRGDPGRLAIQPAQPLAAAPWAVDNQRAVTLQLHVFHNRIDRALFFIIKACRSPLVCGVLAAHPTNPTGIRRPSGASPRWADAEGPNQPFTDAQRRRRRRACEETRT